MASRSSSVSSCGTNCRGILSETSDKKHKDRRGQGGADTYQARHGLVCEDEVCERVKLGIWIRGMIDYRSLHLFVSAKWGTLDGHGESNLRKRWTTCGMDWIGTQGTKIHGPTANKYKDCSEEERMGEETH